MRDLTSLFASVSDWSGFEAAVATLPDTTQQGTAFAHVVRHYLLWEPTYRTKLSAVWFDYDAPADLRTRLNLPPRDKGIDLIARTHSGEFWSIQAKYRTDTAALTFGELATFTPSRSRSTGKSRSPSSAPPPHASPAFPKAWATSATSPLKHRPHKRHHLRIKADVFSPPLTPTPCIYTVCT